MTYDEARTYLAGLVNYEQQSPSATDLALEPIRELLDALGNPHRRLAVVHVAGTNGKGSFAALLDEILQQAGYRTGLYTTPALCQFEDQIRVSGVPIAREDCADHVRVIRGTIAGGATQRPPTYFDVVTAMAFRHFDAQGVNVAIIEVGLGGRNDSTNVCTPILTAITSIGYDHTTQLGPDLASIARQKAGVIKPGCPCVSGVEPAEARQVIEAACAERQAPLTQLGVHLLYACSPAVFSDGALTPARLAVATPRRTWPDVDLRLLGAHQAANAALAVAAVELLRDRGFAISDQAVRQGLARVRCPARIEIISTQPLVVLDCSHNPAAAGALVATLAQTFSDHVGPHRRPDGRRFLIFGASRDKEIPALLRILGNHFDQICLTSYHRSHRSATRQELEAALRASGVERPSWYAADVAAAYRTVAAEASAADFICVTGSVFLAGELLSAWANPGG